MPKPSGEPPILTTNQIDGAARRIRLWAQGRAMEVRQEDIAVVQNFRRIFVHPLKLVDAGLRQFVRQVQTVPAVTERLKRFDAIVAKLGRGSMRLTQMEDIGGCRAVLLSGREAVQHVLDRIQANWEVSSVLDYAAAPQPTGYRAIHVIVVREGRTMEIQLRTPAQQYWAEKVEEFDRRFRLDLKHGDAPPALMRYFELGSEILATREKGANSPAAMETELRDLMDHVWQYFVPEQSAP